MIKLKSITFVEAIPRFGGTYTGPDAYLDSSLASVLFGAHIVPLSNVRHMVRDMDPTPETQAVEAVVEPVPAPKKSRK